MRLLICGYQQGGWKVCGSSRGFRLSVGSVLSPDDSLIRLDRWQALTAAVLQFHLALVRRLVT